MISACVLVFARYPVPGQAKTRLIPALGPEGAAQLYRHLAERSIAQVRAITPAVAIALWYSGASAPVMRTWLGDDLIYCPQPPGDLGQRLTAALDWAFDQGYASALVVGTDCPDLDTAILTQGLEALARGSDCVLGPAQDGGYYLLGLRSPQPALFQGIAWSTEVVLAQTVAQAQRLGLTPTYLPTLIDMDTPEDLAHLPPTLRPAGF
ncbi:MAG: TIGR04282 family arsenosugar biosynthesis glycosyltransferase [Leptolyngbya sp.]|nr:TIGR04282 family arsenosugar biosynthesis glycosyltransferase [Leptolyngbya sp.]